jgi:aspartate aminotransferase-like enzyme
VSENEDPNAGRFTEAIDEFANARLALDEVKDTLEVAQSKYDAAEAHLFDLLEASGLRQVRTARGLFTMNDLAWAAVEDGEKAREWADTFMPEIITLNRSRLAVVVRNCLKEGDPLPPGVSYTTSRKVTWRRQ